MSGDGGPATQAGLGTLDQISLDTGNHLYLSSKRVYSLRSVDFTTGTINTIAGNAASASGFSGDGGPATAATLGVTAALSTDGNNNLYIADSSNNRIRIIGEGVLTPRPTVSSLSPTQGISGTTVTISGSGFGSTQTTSTVSFGNVTATPTSWSSTSIVVPVPSGAQTGPVFVTVAGLSESSPPTFTILHPPQLNSVSPSEGGPGGIVTITGSNFGPAQGSSTVDFQGQPAPQITNVTWSDSKVTFVIPQISVNYSIDGLISLVTAAGSSNAAAFTILSSVPGVTAILPDPGSIGTQVTIYGTNFGSAMGQSTVTFGSVSATPISWSPTAIVVTVPSGAATGNVSVTVSGNTSSGFLYLVSGSCPPAS